MPDPLPDSEIAVETPGKDITDIALPSLSEDTQEERHFGQHVSRPPAEPVIEGADASSTEVLADGGAVPQRKRRSLQERINDLTRHRREAEEQSSYLSTQIQEMMRANEALRTQLENSSRPAVRQSAGIDAVFGDLEGGSPRAPAAAAAQPLPNIEEAVGKALQAYDQRRRTEESEILKIQSAQRSSFTTAAEEFPELSDPRTEAGKLFAQLWDSSPLRGTPNGPYQVALMVRGLLADEVPGRTSPVGALDDRKRQASVIAPKPQPTGLPGISRKQLEQAYKAALQRHRDTKDPRAYAEARKIQHRLNQTK